MAGRSSSLLVAKMVLLIALLNTSVDISTTVGLVTAAILGKSVAFSPANLYRPLSELIAMLYVSLSILKVTGCSGRFFRVSINILAGTAILPSSFASKSISVIMEVCKSEAVTVNFPSFISKRKFSKIGTTGLVVTTPLIADRCFKRVEELTINFIDINFNAANNHQSKEGLFNLINKRPAIPIFISLEFREDGLQEGKFRNKFINAVTGSTNLSHKP